MACIECAIAVGGSHRRFCLKCHWCGARLIQAIQAIPLQAALKSSRCKVVLDDWVAYGHSEAEIRRLAKLPNKAIEVIETEADERPNKKPRKKK